jgi:hypothetical protein
MVAADGTLVDDRELADRLSRVAATRAWIAMASCYGGGFTEVLGPGRILTGAAPADALAYETTQYGRSFLVQYMVREAMIDRKAPGSVQAAFAYATAELARRHPTRLPVQVDLAGAPLDVGMLLSAATAPVPVPPPATPTPPPTAPCRRLLILACPPGPDAAASTGAAGRAGAGAGAGSSQTISSPSSNTSTVRLSGCGRTWMERNCSRSSNTLIDPRGGGVNQWMTTTPVEKWTPSSTMPVPETPDTSNSRRIVKRRIPSGARSTVAPPSRVLSARSARTEANA